MQSVPDNQRRSKCSRHSERSTRVLHRLPCPMGRHLKPLGLARKGSRPTSGGMTLVDPLKTWTHYGYIHDKLARSLPRCETQELTFSSIGHFSLSQWFRTSSLNAPVLPTVLCWILAIVVASFTISIIPVGGGTESDVNWGLVPEPEGERLGLCWPEGRGLFNQGAIFQDCAGGFLKRDRKGRRRMWKFCGTCFQCPWMKRERLVLKGDKRWCLANSTFSFFESQGQMEVVLYSSRIRSLNKTTCGWNKNVKCL